ncbi:glycosyltransferase family 2 protein [Microcella daejeonensis]|uniref:Glycosyltransferase family 2 protein n=1 Tax=Microcella daejeonensis TaxID=2994971 RepID=A0A9E8MK19_9MICO|nr:glycosyltransferase family 2 protein [Microcella daejeonensis]WAB80507.1 glycosyltransferase family 2 protein [Microcella daejeonensis]
MPSSPAVPSRPNALPPTRKRQWGAEKRTTPLPIVHPRPSDRRIALARMAIVATVAFWAVYVVYTVIAEFLNNGTQSFAFTTQAISYVVVVTFLTFSALMYLIARHGALQRFRAHVRTPRAELDRHFADRSTAMTVLVPSYAEEPDVVATTLWSAALQEYPNLRVVLLVDDPPHPTEPLVAARLEATRALSTTITEALALPGGRFRDALLQREVAGTDDLDDAEVAEVIGHFRWAVRWIDQRIAEHTVSDHVDVFFVEQVLGGLRHELELTGDALENARLEGFALTAAHAVHLMRRLAWTFSAEVDVFERKRFAGLSHEANKAMNLNAYIGLMGGSYAYEETPDGTVLRPVSFGQPADLVIPDSDYLLTLDADSMLLRDYCLRLVHSMEQPENARVAVTQTPYSSYRGASTRIERLAAATTDIQHILHQGFSYHNATFWVGANAVIRKRALDDIVQIETSGGFTIKRYVQDRTVIEDTESSIDLGTHGWTLVNYPERLSYSATPPDFGSLVIQRRRWANGGLLILPKYFRQIRERRARGERVTKTEILLRMNYMSSIAWASFGLVFLLAYPYDSRLLSPMVLLAALPYFIAMASDLRYAGYKASDVFRIYGFNLILLPVNLAGVIKSIEQAITSKKIPFARTPKVRNRTTTPLLYVLAPYLIIAFSVFTLWRDVQAENWGNAAFAGFNAILALAAVIAYIGIGSSLVDIFYGLTNWLYAKPKNRTGASAAPAAEAAADWRTVLYHGAIHDHAADSPAPVLAGSTERKAS